MWKSLSWTDPFSSLKADDEDFLLLNSFLGSGTGTDSALERDLGLVVTDALGRPLGTWNIDWNYWASRGESKMERTCKVPKRREISSSGADFFTGSPCPCNPIWYLCLVALLESSKSLGSETQNRVYGINVHSWHSSSSLAIDYKINCLPIVWRNLTISFASSQLEASKHESKSKRAWCWAITGTSRFCKIRR